MVEVIQLNTDYHLEVAFLSLRTSLGGELNTARLRLAINFRIVNESNNILTNFCIIYIFKLSLSPMRLM